MNQTEINTILKKQRTFFATDRTKLPGFRLRALDRLYKAILKFKPEILSALKTDLGKSASEGYMCEIGLVLSEITYMKNHVHQFSRARRVITPLANYVSRSYRKPVPYGSVLIMSPWNYPFLLTIEPLVDALAAGNTAVLKPSAYSPATSAVMEEMISSIFPPEYVAVVQGGRAENRQLLDADFDYIFFTGSMAVGREVMRRAAEHLTPVTLELGGKSPCFVDETANIPLAAKRIVFGKYLNCGQTCVAPDYVLCHKSVAEELTAQIQKQITAQYGEKPLDNQNYGKIINARHFHRICGLINPQKCVAGGQAREETLQIAPTVLTNVTWQDAVMKEEIFGPVLPILTYDSLEEAARKVESMPHPLACYIFSSSRSHIRYLETHCQFGGGCINDTIIHLATSTMGFGGVGASGMGSYHGKDGFNTFSHYKSMVDKKTWLDLPIRYQPYGSYKDKLIRLFVK